MLNHFAIRSPVDMPGRIRIESLLPKCGFICFSLSFLHKRRNQLSRKDAASHEMWPVKKREGSLTNELPWVEQGWLWRLICFSVLGFAPMLGLLLGDKATLIPIRITEAWG